MNTEVYSSDELRVELQRGDELTLRFSGKSMAREPGQFLLPILTRAVEEAEARGVRLILDFRPLEYLNSSTITPVIRLLDQARKGAAQVTITYDASLAWQRLSFTALTVFATTDGRLTVNG